MTGHRPARYAIGGAVCLLASSVASVAGTPRDEENKRLDQVERALAEDRAKAAALESKAKALKAEVEALRRDMVAAAKAAQDLEEEISAKESELAELEVRRADMLTALKRQHGRLSRTLGALQRIALTPPEIAIAAPGSPIETARSALLLSSAVPGIERRAKSLRGDLIALDYLRAQIAEDRAVLAAATQALGEKQKSISSLIEKKHALEKVATAEQRAARARARMLAREAKTLRELMAKLDQDAQERVEREARESVALRAEAEARRTAREPERREAGDVAVPEPETQQALLTPPVMPVPLAKPANVRRFPETPSVASLVMPARGRMVITYGAQEAGEAAASKGVSIETRPFAQVVAPYDGRVAYAGEFRGYGQILIIEHGGRYHTLLAGLGRIDAVAGQWVLAGEPVGTMSRAESGGQVLYLELRRTGQPINPLPWLATTNDKVQG